MLGKNGKLDQLQAEDKLEGFHYSTQLHYRNQEAYKSIHCSRFRKGLIIGLCQVFEILALRLTNFDSSSALPEKKDSEQFPLCLRLHRELENLFLQPLGTVRE